MKQKLFTPDFESKMPSEEQAEVCTLLIPEKWMQYFVESSRYEYAGYLHYLLRRYKRFLLSGNIPANPPTIKVQYQDKFQLLTRVNFRPSEEDWADLSLLAKALGVSRCKLFVILLWFDWMQLHQKHLSKAEEVGVPTFPAHISITQSMDRSTGFYHTLVKAIPSVWEIWNQTRHVENLMEKHKESQFEKT